MRLLIILLFPVFSQAQTYTNKQLSDKVRAIEAALANQTKLNTRLIADTVSKSKRIASLEAHRNWIESLTLIPDTLTDFKLEGRILRIRRK